MIWHAEKRGLLKQEVEIVAAISGITSFILACVVAAQLQIDAHMQETMSI
jgi:cysteine synthase